MGPTPRPSDENFFSPLRTQGVLLDQFGCLHDGQKPYPGAIDAVSALAAAGLQILLLSNSSRRACWHHIIPYAPSRVG